MTLTHLPRVGDHVPVVFLGALVDGVIGEIDEQRRQLHVLTADGETITFALSRATGQFMADGSSSGPRLVFPNRH